MEKKPQLGPEFCADIRTLNLEDEDCEEIVLAELSAM
jgi:hypothetical protein